MNTHQVSKVDHIATATLIIGKVNDLHIVSVAISYHLLGNQTGERLQKSHLFGFDVFGCGVDEIGRCVG